MLDARDDRTRAEASNSAATGASVVAWRMSKERPHPRAKEMQDVFEEFESARHWVYRTGRKGSVLVFYTEIDNDLANDLRKP